MSSGSRVGQRCWLCASDSFEDFAALPLVGDRVFRYARCHACGLARLLDTGDNRDLGVFYASEYEPICGDFTVGHRSLLSILRGANYHLMGRRIEALVRKGRLLDVGCGAGVFLATMRQRGWAVAGLEPNRAYAQSLQSRYGLDVHVGMLEDMPTGWGSFDAVTLLDVIEHLPDPSAALTRAWQALRPGGVLAITTPNVASIEHRLFGRHWFALQPPDHLWLFSASSLKQLATNAGFESVSLAGSPVSYGWPSLRRLMRVGALPDPAESAAKALMGMPIGALSVLLGAPANIELYAERAR